MALTKDRNTIMKDGELIVVPVAANAVIYAGAIVVANASGYADKGSTALGLTFLGRADERVDNTGGANGAKTVQVRRGKAFKWKNDATHPVTQASLGRKCYIVDDETVAIHDNSAARSAAGIVVALDSDGVWVAEPNEKVLSAVAALDFPNIVAQTGAELTITVAGAAVGDTVELGPPAALEAGLAATGYVSAANTVTVRLLNVTAGAINPASASWRATVRKP